MAIIVEDGLGLLDSETYITVVFFKDYFKDRNVAITQSTGVIEAHLRLSTEYMDLRWGPGAPGGPIVELQALVWPRDYFVDPLPLQLLRAQAEYTLFSFTSPLFINKEYTEAGILQLTENVGPIQTTTKFSGGGDNANGPKYPKVSKGDSLMRMLNILGTGEGGVIR